jgi:DNA-binding response OmpR family regulator
VLIADDDRLTRAMLDSWLTGSGYGVVEARDGVEALRLAGEREPDLLLVDLIMPGIDGYEVCRTIRTGRDSRPPVIFITAHDWTGGHMMALEAGAVDYVAKPFVREELIARVGLALARQPTSSTLPERPGRSEWATASRTSARS